jgi:hypothetical protein
MKNITEDKLEEFIRRNKDEFNVYRPEEKHEGKFLVKLTFKLRRVVINIAPYLVKVCVGVVAIWAISLALWYIFKIPTLWDLVINWLKH